MRGNFCSEDSPSLEEIRVRGKIQNPGFSVLRRSSGNRKNPKARNLNDMIFGNLANPDLFGSSTKLVYRRALPDARATPY
jgi:hypothetical protein